MAGLFKGVVGTALFLIYLTFSAIYLVAILDGLTEWVGLHWIIAGPIAFVLAFIPFIGPACAVIGAVFVWGFKWWLAAGIFAAPYLFFMALFAASSLVDAWDNRSARLR